ncbi:hypothetical protein [Pedobacter westerhofensis]|uniref:hypothetical protein n=1 Tax=Pedobacter westerhofensis TaxID=425512 RepID=UPI00163DDA52|nr:hypothetical protein [Pedobacter westerhofensis]
MSGIPPFYAKFASDWASAMKAGEFEETVTDLEDILGRKPESLEKFLRFVYGTKI